jgi:hypothetical protein
MKKYYYIRNVKTDENFDPQEMRFYKNNWQPEYTEDKVYLESLLKEYEDKFENCIIEKVEFED